MDQLLEIWLPVKDYEGLYEVSNLGRVKSLNYHRTGEERILKGIIQHTGYLHVTLCKNKKYKQFRVHRLVAQAFLDNPLNLPQVNHKDCNPQNNRANNLEFCTAKYNNNYGTHNERMAKTKSKPVLQYTLKGELVREWPSTNEAARQGGYNKGHISSCCLGKCKTHKGFMWKYTEQP